jgi:hypothetical protein
MKLYIESYQSRIEELEPLEEKFPKLEEELAHAEKCKVKFELELDMVNKALKEKKAEWKLKEQELQSQISKSATKQNVLEEKIKELEKFMVTNKNLVKGEKHQKNDLILLKDESCKINKNQKIKYLLKAIPGGSTKHDEDDAFISFSEMSTKVPDRSKPGSLKKKVNPYKIEYFKNKTDLADVNITQGSYQNTSVEEKHKRSKSQTVNSLKSKKVSKSQESSVLIGNSHNQSMNTRTSYNLVNEYLENPQKFKEDYCVKDVAYQLDSHKRSGSRSRGKREKLINYPANSFVKAPNIFKSKKRLGNSSNHAVKKMSFKSFDQRRALTKLDHRDTSLDDPANYLYSNPLRSSSACHKKSFSNERHSSPSKPKMKAAKPSSHRSKKTKNRSQIGVLKRVSATQAMINLIKSCKNKQ